MNSPEDIAKAITEHAGLAPAPKLLNMLMQECHFSLDIGAYARALMLINEALKEEREKKS